jgi:lysophospholipase L1-like esterase
MKTVIMILLLASMSCKQADTERPLPENEPVQTEKKMNYLALGDSYTIGEGVTISERWPMQLTQALKAKNFDVENPQIIARTGWTTDELMRAIDEANISDTFDLVSLLIGVNNQYRGRPVEQFRLDLVSLIEKALTFAGNDTSRVFMLSIPDWGATPFASGRDREKIASEINAYNYVIHQETSARNILFVNITPISREALSDPTLLANDRLHPSGKMYLRWVNELLPRLTPQIHK